MQMMWNRILTKDLDLSVVNESQCLRSFDTAWKPNQRTEGLRIMDDLKDRMFVASNFKG